MSAPAKAPAALPTRILFGFLAGTLLGLAANALAPAALTPAVGWLVTNVAEPAGRIFLRLLLMTTVPLVVTSLTLGVAGLGNPRRLGRVGIKTAALVVMVSSVSVGLGLTLANLIRPGERVPAEVREQLFTVQPASISQALTGPSGPGKTAAQSLVELVPENPFASASRSPPDMLGVMVFAILLGIGLAMAKEKGQAFAAFFESAFAVLQKVIAAVMWLAPFGVGALLFAMTARFGFGVLRGLAAFVGTVLAGLLLHQFLFYSALLKLWGRVSPLEFFRRTRQVMATAFATSSSNATLPTALECAERDLRLPREVSTFVLTVGATANQNGTALYEGVTVLFLAQLFGVDLSLGQQLMVLGMALVAGVGTAGVPSGSLPFIALILQTIHVPAEGIAVILGVDRLLDMCRTVPNVVGDLVLATLVSRSEGAQVMAAPETDSSEQPSL